jgi:GNAT superfamily N-acetyltransferase
MTVWSVGPHEEAGGPKVEIASFRQELVQGIADLILPIQRQEFGFAIAYDDQPDLKDIAGFYGYGDGGFWVALVGPRVVGTIGLRDISERQGALRKMFVAREFRGAGSGVAARLLATLLAHARAVAMRRVYLGTTERFRAAHRFYEKHGFVRVPPESLPERFPRMEVDTRFYLIDL